MPLDSIAVGQNADGRLQLFASTHCKRLDYTCCQVAPSSGWGPWHRLGPLEFGPMVQCAAEQNADGRLEVFMLRSDGRCTQFWQGSPNGEFGEGRDIGAVAWEQIAMARNADGRLELFALVGGNIYHLWQIAPSNGWTPSEPFGTMGLKQMAVASNADGRLEVFGLGGDGNIWHFWQGAGNTGWSHAEPFGTTGLTQMVIARNADGRLEIFGLGGDGNIWHFWQTAPNNGWSHSEPFGTIAWKQMLVARNADGRLEVFGLAGGNVWHFWQTAPSNGWSHSQCFPDPEPWPWVTLTASPTHIVKGQSAQLTWDSGNADTVRRNDSNDPNWGPRGSKTVSPTSSTEYELCAISGRCVATATASVTVEVPAATEPVDLLGIFWALNEGTEPCQVTLTISGILQSSKGSGGRTSFSNEIARGELPRGMGQAPGTLGQVQFRITGLQRGVWTVTVSSNIAGRVTCEFSLPSLVQNFNATGRGDPCQGPPLV